MFPLINQGFDSTLEPSYFSKTYSDKSGGPELINKTITENGTYSAKEENADGYSTITVDVSGSSSGSAMDVIFYDYDGTILYNYSASEFADLSAMPANPSHEGLTAQGWNWSLADAKAYVANYGKLNIGQMYNTSDGKTRIYITLSDGRLEPYLGLGINGSVDVDWGDGSEHDTMTGSKVSAAVLKSHKYATAGDYVIALEVTGSMSFLHNGAKGPLLLTANRTTTDQNAVYMRTVHEVRIGSNVTSIDNKVFQSCYSLTSVIIPSSVTSIGSYAFYGCTALKFITIPNNVTSLNTNTFQNCFALASVTIPSSITSIGASAFGGCYVLASVTIPSQVTSIGASTFTSCYALTSITIPSKVTSIGTYTFQNCFSLNAITIPSSVTDIGAYAFQNCYALSSVTIPSNVTSIGSTAFSGCRALTSIIIPSTVTKIEGNAFQDCSALNSITIPSSVTSIDNYAFSNSSALASVTIPSKVTSIGHYAFQNCYGLGYIRFIGETPPTVSSFSAWTSIPTDCIIYIPLGTYITYTKASNYPSPSSYNYVEYATYADGTALPSTSQDETRTYTWYATIEDWLAQTNPITVGNGNEIYCRSAAV
jgi:hypothetical protein